MRRVKVHEPMQEVAEAPIFAMNFQIGQKPRDEHKIERALSHNLVCNPDSATLRVSSLGVFMAPSQVAQPAIGQIDLHFSADAPLRADGKHITDDEHPDHKHRIDPCLSSRRPIIAEPR
jgi:hypothetical protein